ncbi:serine hydrolase [soil metagenome]
MKRILQLFFTLIIFVSYLPHSIAQNAVPDNFEQWVEEGLAEWNIPGITVSLVKDGEVIYTRGLGIKKLSSREPVDEHTQFGIASVSKHMTATALGILADRGEIDWDDRVIDHVPWFQLSDAHATATVTIRDLLTHQVGIGRMLGNRQQFMTQRGTEELLYRMRYHDFEQPFRSSYVYSNVMYTLAGHIIKEVTGQEFGDFLETELFGPLEMDRTVSTINDLDEENAAWPHQEISGEVVEIPRRNWDNAAPAGGVNSTATDMARWMKFQLGTPGSHNENELVRPETMQTIQTPKVAQNIGTVTASQSSYGFGLSITDYNGFRQLSHGGATDGMNSVYILLPELDMGVIVITNTFSSFQQAVARTLIDHHIDPQADIDWNRFYRDNYLDRYERTMERREEFEASRISGTTPARSLTSYTGTYKDELYDNANIFLENDQLVIRLWDDENITADLEHWHYDTFRVNWRNPALREDFLTFRLGIDGQVESLDKRFTLRPVMLQVGTYPTDYYRIVNFEKTEE